MYKELEKQHSETFAKTIQNHRIDILKIPDIDKILRYAGKDAEPLLPCLIKQLEDCKRQNIVADDPSETPFTLLEKAGYNSFHADTRDKQDSIKKFFAPGELLCTFNSARYQRYHIIHAIKKNASSILREDFNGREKREDEYGTSVISIQIRKKKPEKETEQRPRIRITNRYNHTINTNSIKTFDGNPDNIIPGLSYALKKFFNVEFSFPDELLPDSFTNIGQQIFKYRKKENDFYYGDQCWIEDDQIYDVDTAGGDALFEGFIFDNKTKTLKNIDPDNEDSFADDFNRAYGGNEGLIIKNGNLFLKGRNKPLITAENSSVTELYLPDITEMGDYSLHHLPNLKKFEAQNLKKMGNNCLYYVFRLTEFKADALETMGNKCLYSIDYLPSFTARNLKTIGDKCLYYARNLTEIDVDALETAGNDCLYYANNLTNMVATSLIKTGNSFLHIAPKLTNAIHPNLIELGDNCYTSTPKLEDLDTPSLITLGKNSFFHAFNLRYIRTTLKNMGENCFANSRNIKLFLHNLSRQAQKESNFDFSKLIANQNPVTALQP